MGRLGRQVAAQASRIGARVARQPRSRVIAMATAIVVVAAGTGTYSVARLGTTSDLGAGARIGRPPLRILSVTPASGSRNVDGDEPVQVAFSAPLAAGSPLPSVTPKVPGSWQSAGDTMIFTPAVPFRPSTRITVTIPGGRAGVRSATGGLLAEPGAAHFGTGAYSVRRLSELLAELGYLPVSWQQQDLGRQLPRPVELISSRMANQAALAYSPPPGTFTMNQGYPASLISIWQPDTFNVIIQGAVMAFESEHDMPVNGVPDLALWDALFRAEAAGEKNSKGYTYAIANKGNPETLTIWHDGRIVLHSLANTGISASPTVDGTFPVYRRYRYQIMRGTNPDGSHYADPVSFVSYFHGGDAVHYYARASYGYPQSLGCVELPYSAAEQAWRYLTLGVTVRVTG